MSVEKKINKACLNCLNRNLICSGTFIGIKDDFVCFKKGIKPSVDEDTIYQEYIQKLEDTVEIKSNEVNEKIDTSAFKEQIVTRLEEGDVIVIKNKRNITKEENDWLYEAFKEITTNRNLKNVSLLILNEGQDIEVLRAKDKITKNDYLFGEIQ